MPIGPYHTQPDHQQQRGLQQRQQQQQQQQVAPPAVVAYDNQVWTEYQDDLGRVYVRIFVFAPPALTAFVDSVCRYYHNVLTNATQWDRPPPAPQRW
jgi:hypothetical protein